MKVRFQVDAVRPDMRPFRQNAFEMYPTLPLQVEVEMDVVSAPTSDGNTLLVTSLQGLRDLADQFDLMFVGNTPSNEVESGEDVWEALDGIKDEDHDEFESDNDEDEW